VWNKWYFRATIIVHKAPLVINFSIITISIFFCAEMDREWMHLSQTDKRYMLGVSKFIADAKADAGMETLSSNHAKIA
jgi:hypothetical protein